MLPDRDRSKEYSRSPIHIPQSALDRSQSPPHSWIPLRKDVCVCVCVMMIKGEGVCDDD